MAFGIEKHKDKFQIMGTGDGWNLAPLKSDAIIYCLNDYIKFERYGIKPDVLFIMDVLDEKPLIVSGIDNLGEVINRINQMGVPLIAPYKYAEIPLSQAFPIKECIKEFGLPYLNNTISYMIAHALLSGAKEIDIYGVNQASSGEYFYEKASVEYWLGIANGRGVKITINGAKSELLSNKARMGGNILYGYNMTAEGVFRIAEKYGEQIVKKLLVPPNPISKNIRQVN